MKAQNIIGALALFGASVHALDQNILGCYKTTTGLVFNSTWPYNSFGYCSGVCANSPVFGMMDLKCYCGTELPPDSDKVSKDDPKCNMGCKGYPTKDICGTSGMILVFDGGVLGEIPKASETASSSASATNTAKSSSTTVSTETVLVTASGDANQAKSSKPNTAGIAAGVVIGVLAIAGIAGGLFVFMRNRKRRAIEEEHRRNAAVSSFIGSGKPSSSGGASSFTDTRLDPVMAQRRMSDGSIADNQDYSRRILKVTNA